MSSTAPLRSVEMVPVRFVSLKRIIASQLHVGTLSQCFIPFVCEPVKEFVCQDRDLVFFVKPFKAIRRFTFSLHVLPKRYRL